MSIPKDIVEKGMAAFEGKYNANDMDFCGSCYTDECFVTVNGGKDAGGFGPFTTPAEVSAFLHSLRNDMGATDMKFTVTETTGCNHKDTWTSATFTGACDADWVEVEGSPLGWKIKKDAITAAPKAVAASVPEEVVTKGMAAFEEKYNANDMDFCGSCYTDECFVTVNGGKDAGGFGPFTTPAEVSTFLNSLRNDMGATDMKFIVTETTGCNHKDTWTSATFTGACDADWVEVEGSPLGWKIKKDAIAATPKAA